ncbi:hypothetical protein SBBP2_880011 [Burkholderiales bacterium]|nr:hypothetical protein SBBP2_880011 [Burkholderiales bacterium]
MHADEVCEDIIALQLHQLVRGRQIRYSLGHCAEAKLGNIKTGVAQQAVAHGVLSQLRQHRQG